MQLLTLGFLNKFVTALAVSCLLAVLATFCVWILRSTRTNLFLIFFSVLAFSMLGFVTGTIMGNSREAAVGTVVPAILTLLGSVSIYVMGIRGTRVQGPVAAMMLCFALSLYAGSHFGAQLRYGYETFLNDPDRLARYDLLVEKKRQAVELQRLLDYVEMQQLIAKFAQSNKVDLSKFEIQSTKPEKGDLSSKNSLDK